MKPSGSGSASGSSLGPRVTQQNGNKVEIGALRQFDIQHKAYGACSTF